MVIKGTDDHFQITSVKKRQNSRTPT